METASNIREFPTSCAHADATSGTPAFSTASRSIAERVTAR